MTSSCTAFQGDRRVAAGAPADVALQLKHGTGEPVLIFDDATGQQIEFDLRGSDADVLARLAPPAEMDTPPEAGRGRPRLGVVAREVTLLPRHWEWLNLQSGGASATLRRLVDTARVASGGTDAARRSRQAADRFMAALAGDRPGYEEASRALYAGDRARFAAEIAAWPQDVREHALRLAEAGLAGPAA